MPNDLHDQCILVTRPKPQGEELCARIKELGGKPIYFPTIEIKPIQDKDLFRQYMESLPDYDWLIFISPQAVFHSSAWIHQYWPRLPDKTKLAAIGEGTSRALQAAGFTDITHPLDEWNSEGLLKLLCFKEGVAGKKIMLVTGAGGREVLADTFTSRGAIITHWVVYERVLPVARMTDEDQIDIIVCTSGESLRNLIKLTGQTTQSHPPTPQTQCHPREGGDLFGMNPQLNGNDNPLISIPLVVISQRLVELAHELGFKKVFLSKNASHNAIIETIKGMKHVRK